jgi:hypothetical protein
MLDKFSFARSELSSGQQVASGEELLDLLGMCLARYDSRKCFIVIDGIDECRDSGTFIRDLLRTCQYSKAKILLFSRPNTAQLPEVVLSAQKCSIGKETSPDIRLFLSQALNSLRHSRRLPLDADIPLLLSQLTTGADGMFLWARLMVDYLNATSLTASERVKIIRSVIFPERLEKMYDRIIGLINSGFKEDSKFASFIIMWLIYAKRPLTTAEMRDAVMALKGSDYPDFEHTVLATCTCLVERYKFDNQRFQKDAHGFRLIHLSAREYFLKSSFKNNMLYIPEIEADFEITRICLEYLTKRLPEQSLRDEFGKEASPAEVDNLLPLCNYAAANWMEHLRKIKIAKPQSNPEASSLLKEQGRQLSDLVLRFLSQKSILMSWIEATFLFEKILNPSGLREWSEFHMGLRGTLVEREEHAVFEESLRFSDELEQLNNDWGPKLAESPSCIWLECTAFTSYPHLTRSTKMTFTPLSARGTDSSAECDQELCRISESSTDGRKVCILKIIPSRYVSYEINNRIASLSWRLIIQ